jgi:anti-sigma regulatory factor (Ser/Thr protein kinase)
MKNLSLHIMDILQNSIRAGASEITLNIEENMAENTYRITFTDNGCGMDEAMVERVVDPFFTTRTVRKVGLGLPLLKQNCEQTGGSLRIVSKVGEGTQVEAVFTHNHIDRPATGDIAGTVVLTASSHPDIRFIYHHQKDGQPYTFDTEEVKEALDGLSIQQPEIIRYLREMIEENLKKMLNLQVENK